MIFLDRDRRDGEGRPIRPDQDWFDLAAEARQDALREAGAHKPRATVYGHDQVRILTPEEAIERGADYVVVGRAISESSDPAAVARAILASVR